MHFGEDDDNEIGILINDENFALGVCFDKQSDILFEKMDERKINLWFSQYEIFIVNFNLREEKKIREILFERFFNVSSFANDFKKLTLEFSAGQLPFILHSQNKKNDNIMIFLIPCKDEFLMKQYVKVAIEANTLIYGINQNISYGSFLVKSIMLIKQDDRSKNLLYMSFNKTQLQNYMLNLKRFFKNISFVGDNFENQTTAIVPTSSNNNVRIVSPYSKCLVHFILTKDEKILIHFSPNNNLGMRMEENDFILELFAAFREVMNPIIFNEKRFVKCCCELALKSDTGTYVILKSIIAQANAIATTTTEQQQQQQHNQCDKILNKRTKQTLHLIIHSKNIDQSAEEKENNVIDKAYKKSINFATLCKLECINCKTNNGSFSNSFELDEMNFFFNQQNFGEKVLLTPKKEDRIQLGLKCSSKIITPILITTMIGNRNCIFKSRSKHIKICCLIYSLIKSTILHDYAVAWPLLCNNDKNNMELHSHFTENLDDVLWLNSFSKINLIIV